MKHLESLEFLGGRKPLSEKELEYMRIIWNHPDGISSDEIYNHFQDAPGTTSAILCRISEKGHINVTRIGRHFLYKPQITEVQYNKAIMQTKLKKTFGISQLPNFIAAFCGKKKISQEQFERIERFLKELENE